MNVIRSNALSIRRGYLISRMLIAELEQGRFSILRFYERRVRRIIPALLVMMLIFTPVALFTLIPSNMRAFGQSLIATVLSANNILLFLTVNYFDLAADLKPLMHTWSLGVEEQYYFVVPLLMLGCFRLGRRTGTQAMLLVTAAISFAYCLWASVHAPAANFYLIFSRAWELAAGAAIALSEDRVRQVTALSRRACGALAALGLAVVVLPMTLLGMVVSMPDAYTLLPIAGVCLILLFGHDATNPVTRLLSLRPIVFVGLLSYSAYLYHQPLFAFTRLVSLDEPGPGLMAALIAATFGCAYLSWRFVERPFRDRARIGTRTLLMSCGVASVLLLAIGGAMHVGNGFPQLWPAAVRNDDGLNAARNAQYVEVPRRYTDMPFDRADPRPAVLVLGDSFARDVINMGLEVGFLRGSQISYSEGTSCGEALKPSVIERARQADGIILTVAFEAGTATCMMKLRAAVARHSTAPIVIVGTKSFGVNNNAVMLLPTDRRYTYRIRPRERAIEANTIARRTIPAGIFVDILAKISDPNQRVPVFTPDRRFISQDTQHLTKAGALYIGRLVFSDPIFSRWPASRVSRTCVSPLSMSTDCRAR